MIQLFQLSSNTLVKLVMTGVTTWPQQDLTIPLYQQISLYLHSLIHLEISLIYPTELISIFKSCSLLVYLRAG